MTDKNSANIIDDQIPFTPNINGSINNDKASKTSNLKKDIKAEVSPSLSAVKNEDAYIEKPEKRKANEYIENAFFVTLRSSSS